MDLRTSGSSNSSVPQVALLGCLMQIGKQVPELAWILDAQDGILSPGMKAFGSVRYLLSVLSFQVTSAFFIAG